MLERLTNRYLQLADYFIPEKIKGDRDAHNQARMFLISHTMGPFLGNTVPLALLLVDPTPGLDIAVLALSITAFWIFPFLMKAGVAYEKLVITSVINLCFCILLSCFFNGGVSSPTLSWILIIPLLSFFYIGGEKRLQPTLLTIFGTAFAIFLSLYWYFAPAANDIPQYAMIVLGLVSTAATLAYVATMAIYYSRIFDAGVELENEVRRRRHASEELRLAMAETDRASRMKAEFLARMSHELRTPLNAVIGYSQILREDMPSSTNPQMRKDIDKIHEAGEYLVRLINMILDLSKIESGHMKFVYRPHQMNEIIQDAVEGARAVIDANGNVIEFNGLEDADDARVDRDRLIQVLDSLLSNAGENTRKGKVTVTCTHAGEGNDRVYFIDVADTGKGIDAARLATLFDTYGDKRDASSARYGGTGLNLSVTYRLAKAMGCELSVESQVGVGTNFRVTVPAVPQTEAEPAGDMPEAGHQGMIASPVMA